MKIDLSKYPPGTVVKTRDGRHVTLVHINASNNYVLGCFDGTDRENSWTMFGTWKTGANSPEDVVEILWQPKPSSHPHDSRHIARMIAGAILFANGDYDADGLRCDVLKIEAALESP